METLHVGIGTTRGGLTVFPVWGEHVGARGYSVDAKAAVVGEQPGPAVSTLTATNPGIRPLLICEELAMLWTADTRSEVESDSRKITEALQSWRLSHGGS